MASEDVIELGSSEEEAEPPPKKPKPPLNAMVHFPNKLPGMNLKTSKPKISPKHINPVIFGKGTIGKSVTVTKVKPSNVVTNPFSNKIIMNGMPVKQTGLKQMKPSLKKGMTPNFSRNVVPLKLCQPVIPIRPSNIVVNPATSRSITKLPPGITVKRTPKMPPEKRQEINVVSSGKPRLTGKRKRPVNAGEVVELDDDDPPSLDTGPQWYIRPEDQNESKGKSENDSVDNEESIAETSGDMEKQNNKEPQPKYIEITIEDSPIKPPNKKTDDVEAQLSITVDDSPAKSTAGNANKNNKRRRNGDPHSKKQLKYDKDKEACNTVEIEIDPLPVPNIIANETEQEKSDYDGDHNDNHQDQNNDQVIEIEESPLKIPEEITCSTPKKTTSSISIIKSKPSLILSTDTTTEKGEFHPVYQQFIDLCFEIENSDDMQKIVEKKIKAYYRQVPKEYTESELFIDMVSSKIIAMKAGPEKMYLYIKDIVDELNLQRKMVKSEPVKDAAIIEQENFLYGEDSEFNSKRQRQIRKLEKTLKKLHRAIQKLEEQEVDFDDDEDSVYLLTERYKERMVRVHAKFCQLTNTKMPSEPRVQIDPRPGQPKGPAKKLEKWINKKVPIGTPLPFPDFHDVLRCVREANEEAKLGWNEADIMDEARDLFTRCGKKLQRRRQENEWRLAASRIAAQVDPAEESEDLKKKLENNRRLASVKETEVFNKYADRQNQLNLEAVEIGDREAEESPDESEEEEVTEETSLENKEKRKERIKKLLQAKSKKVSLDNNITDEKQNEVANTENETEKESNEMDTNEKGIENETEEIDDKTKENIKESDEQETIHSLSDDSNKIDSDIDELHLLQKLHSGNEVDSSTLDSSDSESQVAISDTLSSGDSKKSGSDVISIENSSYSESEESQTKTKENQKSESLKEQKADSNEPKSEEGSFNKDRVEAGDVNMEIECSNVGVEMKIHKSNNDEYNESIEDILLASSDEESKDACDLNDEKEKLIDTQNQDNNSNAEVVSLDDETISSKNSSPENDNPLNLRDDDISIGETLIENQKETDHSVQDKVHETNASDEKMDTSSVESVQIANASDEKMDTSSVESVQIVTNDFVDNTQGNKTDLNIANTSEPMAQDLKSNICDIPDNNCVESVRIVANDTTTNNVNLNLGEITEATHRTSENKSDTATDKSDESKPGKECTDHPDSKQNENSKAMDISIEQDL